MTPDEPDDFSGDAFREPPRFLSVHSGQWAYAGGRCTVCGSVSVHTLLRLVTEFGLSHTAEVEQAQVDELLDELLALRHKIVVPA